MIIYIKSKEEIEMFKKAGRQTAELLSKLIDAVEEGMTTEDLDMLSRQLCNFDGSKLAFLNYEGFPHGICTSVNEVLVHGTANKTKLKNGDILSIDVGVEHEGYIGDTAETVIVGNSPSHIVDKCREALNKGIEKAVPGNKISDISSAIYKVAKLSTFSLPLDYGGHGINRHCLHADPFVPNMPDFSDDLTLRPGMVLAIEPMLVDSVHGGTSVDKDGWSVVAAGLSAHCEHTILVTESKPFILTRRDNE